MSIEAGQRLLHYRLAEKIGEGGMGEVWKAVDTSLDRPVAIKILPDAFAADPERAARFEREARLLASLDHANIASVYGLHRDADVSFIAMEYVPGEDLAERIARGAFPVEAALAVAVQVAEALEAAHERGVIHRDLKPANVRVKGSRRSRSSRSPPSRSCASENRGRCFRDGSRKAPTRASAWPSGRTARASCWSVTRGCSADRASWWSCRTGSASWKRSRPAGGSPTRTETFAEIG